MYLSNYIFGKLVMRVSDKGLWKFGKKRNLSINSLDKTPLKRCFPVPCIPSVRKTDWNLQQTNHSAPNTLALLIDLTQHFYTYNLSSTLPHFWLLTFIHTILSSLKVLEILSLICLQYLIATNTSLETHGVRTAEQWSSWGLYHLKVTIEPRVLEQSSLVALVDRISQSATGMVYP